MWSRRYICWVSFVPFAVACARPPETAEGVEAESAAKHAPTSALVAPELPGLERARVEYALQSAASLVDVWPWANADDVCILLVSAESQWVLNCMTCPRLFTPTRERFREKPVCARASDTITTTGQPMPTRDLLSLLPAAAVVPEKHSPHVELTGDQPWIIVSSLDALTAFHPAFGPKTTTEEWLSVFLHEFFHVEQLTTPSFAPVLPQVVTRHWDQDTLLALFENDATYRGMVATEYELLARAAALDEHLTPRQARQALARWNEAYVARRAYLEHREGGATLREADVVFTYLEGLARYVESQFLVAQTHAPARALVTDDRFNAFQPPYPPGYVGLPRTALGERYYYTLGMHLALVLDRADPSWKQHVHEHPEWVVGLARDLAASATRRVNR